MCQFNQENWASRLEGFDFAGRISILGTASAHSIYLMIRSQLQYRISIPTDNNTQEFPPKKPTHSTPLFAYKPLARSPLTLNSLPLSNPLLISESELPEEHRMKTDGCWPS
mmetsp:Transcript_2533/g.4097  ORF Transcript_2533/g.4097 Transcript_2533/m.4097 type:complete len:111 (+) Transcript_2533:914-1246(+)